MNSLNTITKLLTETRKERDEAKKDYELYNTKFYAERYQFANGMAYAYSQCLKYLREERKK